MDGARSSRGRTVVFWLLGFIGGIRAVAKECREPWII